MYLERKGVIEMFDYLYLIRKLFQYKAKSVKDFVEFMKREGEGCTVAVEPYTAAKVSAETLVGVIADFHYMLEFTATTIRGRKIKVIYRQRLFMRFGSDRGYADAKNRRNAAIRLFLLGEQKVQELQAKLPKASVNLIGPNGRPMDDAMFAELHKDAVACGVSA